MRSTLPDFDTLLEMAQRDPDALEQLRIDEIEAVISSAPPQMQCRLRGLQFQIDAQRKIHPTAMGACLKISDMMHDSFNQLRVLLNQISGSQSVIDKEKTSNAQILKFPNS